MRLLGKLDEVPEKDRLFPDYLLTSGNIAELDRRFHENWTWAMCPRHVIGLQAYLRGDVDQARALFAVPARLEFHQYWMFPLEHAVVVPLLEHCAGDSAAFARAYAWGRDHPFAYEQKPWYFARFLAGEIDREAFLNQPHRPRAPFDLPLLEAVVLDRADRKTEATAAYRAYQAIPGYQRFDGVNPFIDGVVSWRIEQLSRP